MAKTFSTTVSHLLDNTPWLRRWFPGTGPRPRPDLVQAAAPGAQVPRCIQLALQGGGAHGAFTWGVLDALLQDPTLAIEAVSGSSAGAMNAVLLADGWMKGGRDGAQQSLAAFWTELGRQMPAALVTHHQDDQVRLSTWGKMLYRWSGVFSPSQINPFDLNPLRELLLREVDFDGLRRHSPLRLFVGTTQVSTGKLRIFRENALTVDVLLASACLPKIHHPIEIEGEAYWDGGFAANPPVAPLVYEGRARDLLLVLLNPLVHHGVPRTVAEIEARTAELAFTVSFMGEMRGLVQAMAVAGADGPGGHLGAGRMPRFHMIDTSQLAPFQQTDTKLLAYGPFLEGLRDLGQARGAAWRDGPAAAVGHHASIDVRALFG